MAEEITPDMLPDTQPDSTVATPQPVSEDVQITTPEQAGPTDDAPAEPEPKGAKTPETNAYAALKEERARRKALEERLKALEASESQEEIEEAEPNPLEGKVAKLERELYLSKFPDLEDKRAELEAYLEENTGLPLDKAVTLFRAENGMLTPPVRKGLEKAVAGTRTAPAPRFTKEEVENLRMNNPDKWLKLAQEGSFDEVSTWN